MINRNLPIKKEGTKYFFTMSSLDNFELSEMDRKYKGIVNVKISRPVSPGTEAQNAAMHSLLSAYYKTGVHSCPEPCTLNDFKTHIKANYGPQISRKVNGRAYLIIKSWANYSKQERTTLIEGLISEIHQSGAYAISSEIREIIISMQENIK